MVKRIACANSNCGTFTMDEELYRKLQRTGDTFYCPDGHAQHFTDTEQDKIKELERENKRLKNKMKILEERLQTINREKDIMRRLERRLIRKTDKVGVFRLHEQGYAWKCSCKGHSQKAYETEGHAQTLFDQHINNTHSGQTPETIEVTT